MHSDRRSKLSVKEIAVFSMLGALMYASKVLMDLLRNIHLIGTFIIAFWHWVVEDDIVVL